MMTIAKHATLFKLLLRREIEGRYRGSWLGLGWSLLTPLAMLAVYAFVFGGIFKSRWSASNEESPLDFALGLFAGLIVFNFFAEAISRAPGLIVAQPNYVKKVVFPLALLPLAAVGAALFHAAMSFAVLLAALAWLGKLSWSALALPLVWLPLALFTLGVTWLLASLGVYWRDLAQLVGPALSALLFLSPVFYPASALPESFRAWLWFNPLALPIEASRAIILLKTPPIEWPAIALYTIAAALVGGTGYYVFVKIEKGFADVL